MPGGPRRVLPAAFVLLAVLGVVAGTALAVGASGPSGVAATDADGEFIQQEATGQQAGTAQQEVTAQQDDAGQPEAPAQQDGAGQQEAAAQQDGGAQDGPTNRTEIRVRLQEDSDARWTITERFNLSTPAERAAFEDLAQRFEDGEAAQLGLPSFRTALSRVEPTVDRPMRIHEVTRTTSVEDGTLRMSFTWTNFAREDNETRYVDDAFTTERGTWLQSLGPNQRLIVALPAGSALDTPKQMTDGTMRWDGPTTFEPGYLRITYTADPPPTIPGIVWVAGAGLIVIVILALLGGYLLTRDGEGRSLPTVPAGGASGDGGSVSAEQSGNGDVATEGTTAAGATAAGEGDGTATDATDDGPDLSLLSDEERVEYLIEENGGRMKQANIVKETGWSNAKVSQLLSSMDEEDRIAKLRIGRENLISFPDEDIGDFEDR